MASTQALNLYSLPFEIFDNVLERLEVGDLQSVRLVSRDIAAISARRFFKNMTVTWTSGKQLRELIEITKPDRPGCWLQHLNVIGVVRVSRPEHYKLLAEAFANLRQNSASGILRSISLVIKARFTDRTLVGCDYIINYDSEPVRKAIARSFETVSHALAHSRLPIQEFDLFTNRSRCSLPLNLIGPVLESADLSPSLTAVKRLSLAVTCHLDLPRSRRHHASPIRYPIDYHKHADDLCRFVNLCPGLETLDLEWYPFIRANWYEQYVCSQLAQLEQFSQLVDCRLKGTATDETTLVELLKKTTRLRRLSLENIHLVHGTFAPVLQYMTSGPLNLEYIYLSSLLDNSGNGAICFVEVVENEVSYSNNSDNLEPTCLTRVGEDTRQPIAYQYTAHRFGRAPHGRRRRCIYP